MKSRESLVMDDVDPFGQAPFNPSKRTPRLQQNGLPADKTGAVKSPSSEKSKPAEGILIHL